MVKKFYMETKDSTLESAILDVWKNAAENNMSGEDSFEVGTDRYRDHTQKMTPGQQVEEALEMSENGQEQLKGLRETILDMWKEAADTHVDPKEREELDKAPENTAKKMKRATEPKPMVATEALDKVNKKELKKDFDKRADDGDADIDNDGDEDDSDKFLHKKRKAISKAIGAKKEDAELDEYITKEGTRKKVAGGDSRMTEGGMKRGKDLKTFKPKPKKEEVEEELTIPQAQEFKVSSMKLALAKVWGLDEGELPPALKKAIDAKKKNGDEDEDKEESVKKGGKTETGKKKAEIEIDPELKEKNKK